MKTCSHCLRQQPLDQFNWHARTTDHKQSWCRRCKREAAMLPRKQWGRGRPASYPWLEAPY